MLEIVVSVVCVLAFYFVFVKKNRTDKLLENVPGPTPLPFFGNSLYFMGPLEETFPKMIAWCSKYGRRFKSKFGPDVFVFLWGVDDLEKLLSSKQHIEKGGDYDFLMPWLGTGLLTNTGEKWATRRKMLTPAFHFRILDEFIDVFNGQSLKLIDILKTEFTRGQVFDVCPYIKRCTLDIICETAMGKQINAQDNRSSPYLTAIHRIGELFQIRIFSPWFANDFLWHLSSYGKEETEQLKIAHGFIEEVIQEKKLKKLAFLDLLILAQQENGLSDVDIRQETDTFMFGGHDTTAANIGFTLFALGSHSEIQAKVQDELDEIFGDDRTRPVRTTDFPQMKYLENCLKESLRLYPSAPVITRRIRSDLKLDDGVTLPAGVSVVSAIFKLHRDAKHFPNPAEFNPDRWSQENTAGNMRHPYAYIPFSAGPRNCIGQKFAMMEEKVIIANLLRNFKLTSVEEKEDLKLSIQITLTSLNGIRLSLEPR